MKMERAQFARWSCQEESWKLFDRSFRIVAILVCMARRGSKRLQGEWDVARYVCPSTLQHLCRCTTRFLPGSIRKLRKSYVREAHALLVVLGAYQGVYDRTATLLARTMARSK